MVEIIASILLVVSTGGAVAIAAKKMPSASQLPDKAADFKLTGIFGAFKKWFAFKAKTNPYLKDFSWMDLAQKALIKGRLAALKTENKINEYMVKLRQRAESQQKEKEALLDNYWHDLKTIVKTKKLAPAKNPKGGAASEAVSEISTGSATENQTGISGAKTKISEFFSGAMGEPTVKTVFPEDDAQRHAHHKKKKQSGSKKKRFRDPFRW